MIQVDYSLIIIIVFIFTVGQFFILFGIMYICIQWM